MQVQKENIRHILLKQARIEFKARGYMKANMRNIAFKCGISTGNIYNYFPNKDELFQEMVRPTIDQIENVFENYNVIDYMNDPYKWGLEYHFEFVEQIASFIDKHRDNLRLVLFKSQGSKLEGYKEALIERYTVLMINSMRVMKKMFPDAVKDVSDFFVHTITSLYASVLTELLMHELPHDDMLKNLKELMLFMYNGWYSFINKDLIFVNEGKT